jgi:hypothetical protein
MAISLPSSPTVGQTYTLGGKIWTWNGTAWKLPSTTSTLPVLYGGTGLTASGNSGNILTSNGTTWTSAAPVVASGTPTLVIVSATTQTAVAGNHYVLTNVAATTVTMPATVVAGDLIFITSGNGLATNVVAYSGSHKIMGLLENLTINTTAYITIQLRYINATIGWVTL